MMELKNILTGVADRLSSLREERPSAGTKYRLMGMVVDITEATETLSKEVLERVKWRRQRRTCWRTHNW